MGPDDDPLLRMLRELGATDEEIHAAAGRGTLGPLAQDLATRGAGPMLDIGAVAAESSVDPDLLERLWVALGLPVGAKVPPRMVDALRMFAGTAAILGDEPVLALARVIGSSMARIAEATSDAFRLAAEVPQLSSGVAYSDVAVGSTEFVRDGLPLYIDGLGAVFQRHLILVSEQVWAPDEAGTAITRRRTVGFADLVGSTELLLSQSVAGLAELLRAFEMLTWDVVTQAGGRLVKLIGDEAMFVFEDPVAACGAALDLAGASPQPVRVALAHGAVVGLHGDYYGATVNLAARLVRSAEPGTVVVAETVHDLVASAGFTASAVDVGPLKGFPGEVAAYALSRP